MGDPDRSETNKDMDKDGTMGKLKDFVEDKSKADKFSGVVAVAKGDKIEFEYVSGMANTEKSIANTMETKFNLGSANKMFTAVAIAQLVEKGLISFTDPVGKLLPDYPNEFVRDQVTVEHLLTHTAGLGSFIDLENRSQFLAARENLKSIQDVVALFKDKPLPYKLGEYHYSSDGYELLGAIVEAVSGQDYYNYVRENIYKPAGMTNTDCYEIDPNNPRVDIAVGYTNRNPQTDEKAEGKKFDNFGLNLLKGTAGGSGYSTCGDMLKFAQALNSNKLLSSEMIEEMFKPRVDLGGKANQHKYQAYGFQVFDVDGKRRVGHPGRFAGVNARFDMYLDLEYTVVVLANYDPPAAFDVAEKAGEVIINSVS